MPYLRIYTPEIAIEQKRRMAEELTDGVLRALGLPDFHKRYITIHFMSLPVEGLGSHYNIELHDRYLDRTKKAKLVGELTPIMMRNLTVHGNDAYKINIIFSEYDPGEFSIGGRFLHELESVRA